MLRPSASSIRALWLSSLRRRIAIRQDPERLSPYERHAAALVASLPVDILRHLFGFLPVHPRVLVLALVCKRWRVAALLSITHQPQSMKLRCAVRLLLTHAHVTEAPPHRISGAQDTLILGMAIACLPSAS